jgi:hypothetical protein
MYHSSTAKPRRASAAAICHVTQNSDLTSPQQPSKMFLPTPLTALLLLLPFLALADEFDAPLPSAAKNARTTTIYAWPLSSASPTPLAEVSFTPRSSAGDYVPLGEFSGSEGELVRVGVDDGKAWSVVRGDLLGRGKVTLRIDNAGEVWGVEVSDEVGFCYTGK